MQKAKEEHGTPANTQPPSPPQPNSEHTAPPAADGQNQRSGKNERGGETDEKERAMNGSLSSLNLPSIDALVNQSFPSGTDSNQPRKSASITSLQESSLPSTRASSIYSLTSLADNEEEQGEGGASHDQKTKRRHRRKFDEVERYYRCNYGKCAKSYGTLNHLNHHIVLQGHGPKRSPEEFTHLRMMLKEHRKRTRSTESGDRPLVQQPVPPQPVPQTYAHVNNPMAILAATASHSAVSANSPLFGGAAQPSPNYQQPQPQIVYQQQHPQPQIVYQHPQPQQQYFASSGRLPSVYQIANQQTTSSYPTAAASPPADLVATAYLSHASTVQASPATAYGSQQRSLFFQQQQVKQQQQYQQQYQPYPSGTGGQQHDLTPVSSIPTTTSSDSAAKQQNNRRSFVDGGHLAHSGSKGLEDPLPLDRQFLAAPLRAGGILQQFGTASTKSILEPHLPASSNGNSTNTSSNDAKDKLSINRLLVSESPQ